MDFNIKTIRADFPILKRIVNGYSIAYLDNAATGQRPLEVINAESNFYQNNYAAVHRGIHTLSAQATTDLENVRNQIASFLNASSSKEIIFVKGTTEGINLVANSWGSSQLKPKDNIIITEMEHHANIVPWQMVAQRTGAEIRVLCLNKKKDNTLEIKDLNKLIDKKTRLLAITHVSNVMGTINPIKEIVSKAKAFGIVTLIDGAQAIMHQKIDVQDINCDFYVFSGHKLYGPTGIGILYGRKELLEIMPPWEGGGSMISNVYLPTGTTWNQIPWRFEAGTPNTAGIIGLGAAISYIEKIGFDIIKEREKKLTNYALNELLLVPDIKIYGSKDRIAIIAFNLNKYHSFDVGTFLDQYGIAIRTGHHCAMPLMNYYNVKSMCRMSLSFYNSEDEIDRLISGLLRIQHILSN